MQVHVIIEIEVKGFAFRLQGHVKPREAGGEFFQERGSGGTVASSAFGVIRNIMRQRYDPSQYNVYLFYASDGENFRDDHDRAANGLAEIASVASYLGYIETPASEDRALETETANIFRALIDDGAPASSFALVNNESVWDAIRGFFQDQVGDESRPGPQRSGADSKSKTPVSETT